MLNCTKHTTHIHSKQQQPGSSACGEVPDASPLGATPKPVQPQAAAVLLQTRFSHLHTKQNTNALATLVEAHLGLSSSSAHQLLLPLAYTAARSAGSSAAICRM